MDLGFRGKAWQQQEKLKSFLRVPIIWCHLRGSAKGTGLLSRFTDELLYGSGVSGSVPTGARDDG